MVAVGEPIGAEDLLRLLRPRDGILVGRLDILTPAVDSDSADDRDQNSEDRQNGASDADNLPG